MSFLRLTPLRRAAAPAVIAHKTPYHQLPTAPYLSGAAGIKHPYTRSPFPHKKMPESPGCKNAPPEPLPQPTVPAIPYGVAANWETAGTGSWDLTVEGKPCGWSKFSVHAFEKLADRFGNDPYDRFQKSAILDGADWFDPEYKLFKGQQRRHVQLGHYIKQPPRFCYIDPEKYFSLRGWQLVLPYSEQFMRILKGLYPARMIFATWIVPLSMLYTIFYIEHRREPLEILMDREEYFRNFESQYYGIYFDHHKFSHMLAKRRANKWQYHDVTLTDDHH